MESLEEKVKQALARCGWNGSKRQEGVEALELMDLFAPSAPGESEDDTKLDDVLASENKKVSINSRMLGAILQA